ncbi:hypothetical protein ACFWYA_20690 [Streptomyces sp. NPDC059011]|uniref:hypothetical protein n=1 Tax=unclassified Streptomyces TaxID=2593676 RepID=UPI003687300F
MSTLCENAWNLIFVVVALAVALNPRDAADRTHDPAMNAVGVTRWFTPTLIRVTCGVLAVVVATESAISPT